MDLQPIAELYLSGVSTPDIGLRFGVTGKTICRALDRHGVVRRSGLLLVEAKAKAGKYQPNVGSFRDGHGGGRTRVPIGTITTRTKARDGRTRRFIKIANPKVWEEYAKWLWKAIYGVLLPDDIVHHLDGDSVNDRPGNILALPRTDHNRFHSRWGIKALSPDQVEFYLNRYRTTSVEASALGRASVSLDLSHDFLRQAAIRISGGTVAK